VNAELLTIYGECLTNTTTFVNEPTYIQFPGELCNEINALLSCGFAGRGCKANRCYGINKDFPCRNSGECNPTLYCDSALKVCKKAKQKDEVCASSDQCDMGMRCRFESDVSVQGYCTKYFSLPSGSRKTLANFKLFTHENLKTPFFVLMALAHLI